MDHRVTTADHVIATIEELAPDLATPIEPQTAIGETGLGFDSVAVLELVLRLEQRLETRLRNEDLDEAALRTVGGLIRYADAHVG